MSVYAYIYTCFEIKPELVIKSVVGETLSEIALASGSLAPGSPGLWLPGSRLPGSLLPGCLDLRKVRFSSTLKHLKENCLQGGLQQGWGLGQGKQGVE